MGDLVEKVDFNIIRYANCWEDADILLEGLSPAPGTRILSIGSAGDNSFALLNTNPEIVVAVDINKTQLYLIELKKAAIKLLTHPEVLSFLGFTPSPQRLKTYDKIKDQLSLEALKYWDSNQQIIEQGVIYSGKFEKYFQLFVKRILPWIHSQKTVANLLATKTASGQQRFYDKTWNNLRWKLLFKIFFSKYVMGKYGRDPQFMKEVDVSVSKTIYKQAEAHLMSVSAQQNFMLHFTLTGNFGNQLPYYLQPENFNRIKQNIDRLVITEGYAQQAISEHGKFGAMNLSNIFEYMDEKTFKNTAEVLLNGMEKNGKLAYWNLMVPRQISQLFADRAVYQSELSGDLTQKDKGFFYNRFIIDTVI